MNEVQTAFNVEQFPILQVPKSIHFVSKLTLGQISNTEKPIAELPEIFAAIKQDCLRHSVVDYQLLAPYLVCYVDTEFLATHSAELLKEDTEFIEAINLEVLDVDYSESNLPRVSIFAQFRIPARSTLSQIEIDTWLSKNNSVTPPIIFAWSLELTELIDIQDPVLTDSKNLVMSKPILI